MGISSRQVLFFMFSLQTPEFAFMNDPECFSLKCEDERVVEKSQFEGGKIALLLRSLSPHWISKDFAGQLSFIKISLQKFKSFLHFVSPHLSQTFLERDYEEEIMSAAGFFMSS